MAEMYNGWRALRSMPHVTFARSPLPDAIGGAVCARWPDGSAVIVIDPSLRRRERHVALTHELVHLERGDVCVGSGFFASKEERAVWREVAQRLVPQVALDRYVGRAIANDEAVTAQMVADEFDTTLSVAEMAVTLFESKMWGTR